MAATRSLFQEIEAEYGVALPGATYQASLEIERLEILNRVTGEWADPVLWRREHSGFEASGESGDATPQL